MSHEQPPPAPPACLIRPYSRKLSQKGGTLIAEDVFDCDEHWRRLADPDGYRPAWCPGCGDTVLHAHDLRFRSPRCQPSLCIRRYLCTACRAGWQILPAFLARHLQRPWKLIEAVVLPEVDAPLAEPRVPRTTSRRYHFRLSCCAAALKAAFSAVEAGIEWALARLTQPLTRAAFCQALSEAGLLPPPTRLASLAAWIHRLVPGLRLM